MLAFVIALSAGLVALLRRRAPAAAAAVADVSWLAAFGRFWWEFVVGDDWRAAVGVVAGIALTAGIAAAGVAAWWVLPVAVAGILYLSLRRATPHRSALASTAAWTLRSRSPPSARTRAGSARSSPSIAVVVPPLALLSAMGVLWGIAFHAVDLLLFLVLYVLCAFGTTIGFHRYFTHRSFEAKQSVKIALGVLGCMTMQGPITQWVTDHRKHHAFSDKPGDPHSPHVGHERGRCGACARGFVHAHVGWMFSNMGMEQGRLYGKDLYDDPVIRWIDRLYLLWVVLTLGLPFALGYLVGGTVEAGLEGLVWGGLIRIFAYQHATFSVNSICHMFGRRDFRSRDESRNNWLVAMLVFGEGWHNNHHAFPTSARHGLKPKQWDLSWLVIRGLERLGLVWAVRVPDEAQLARRRSSAGARKALDSGGRPRSPRRGREAAARARPRASEARRRARAPGISS